MEDRTSQFAILALTALLALPASAAVPKDDKAKPRALGLKATSAPEFKETKEALTLPLEMRIDAIRARGPQGYRNLVMLMLDDTSGVEARWRAVTAIALIGQKNAKPEIETALKSREWYLRNAGLVAMSNVDRESAIKWGRKLLTDKALVVRAAAVATLTDLGDAGSVPLLWEKLRAKENYKGKQSLFIRRHIVESLARLEKHGGEPKFIAVLADPDTSLHAPAIEALERLTKQKLGDSKDPIAFKKEHWQKWWNKEGSKAL